MKKFIEWYGWYGMVAIVFAYILISFSFISPNNVWYQILNGTGALGIVLVSFQKKNYQPGILNIIWTAVALIAIFKIIF
ncbi:MAG: hypothetical protein WCQ00_03875 [bacterium]